MGSINFMLSVSYFIILSYEISLFFSLVSFYFGEKRSVDVAYLRRIYPIFLFELKSSSFSSVLPDMRNN